MCTHPLQSITSLVETLDRLLSCYIDTLRTCVSSRWYVRRTYDRLLYNMASAAEHCKQQAGRVVELYRFLQRTSLNQAAEAALVLLQADLEWRQVSILVQASLGVCIHLHRAWRL